jgi:hypothetical protein
MTLHGTLGGQSARLERTGAVQPEGQRWDLAVRRVRRALVHGGPHVPPSSHDQAMAVPPGDAPVARRVGSRPTHPDQAVLALRLPTLEGHSVRWGRQHLLRPVTARHHRALGSLACLAPDWRKLDQTGVLRVAWTLADLAGKPVPGSDEVAEALGMRLQRVAA